MPEEEKQDSESPVTEEGAAVDPSPEGGSDPDAEIRKWRALARKHEDRAKANSGAAKELEDLRKQSMTEQERAVEQAKADARTATLAEVGGKLAAAEIRAALTGRMDSDRVTALLEGLNPAVFLGEDGEVDTGKVSKWVDGVAPKPDPDGNKPFPDLGQGRRDGTRRTGADAGRAEAERRFGTKAGAQ